MEQGRANCVEGGECGVSPGEQVGLWVDVQGR